MDSLKELALFLDDGSRHDLKTLAVHEVLGLTGSKDSCEMLIQESKILCALAKLVASEDSAICKDASLALINVSSSESGSKALVNLELNIISLLLSQVVKSDSSAADPCCMILSNISRNSSLTPAVTTLVENAEVTLEKLITIFSNLKYNSKGCNLHYLGPFFSNLSQAACFRRYILDKEKCVIQRLLPFVEYSDSITRRGGVVGVIKNCCFDYEFHEWLLSEEVDILPRLLLPLAGGEEFDDEDNEKLPIDLQYLPEEKQREPDPDIRKMLLEALEQLCATRTSREYLRSKNTYIILRELHKKEKNREVLLACENVIDILIRTEEEIGEDNLKTVEVPEKFAADFNKMDEEYLNETTQS